MRNGRLLEAHGVPLEDPWLREALRHERICGDEPLGIPASVAGFPGLRVRVACGQRSACGYAPVEAANKALAKAGIGWDQVGAVELNEAFAAQSLACINAWGIDHAIVNRHGGAIAMGHPLGASGGRILGTLARSCRPPGNAGASPRSAAASTHVDGDPARQLKLTHGGGADENASGIDGRERSR
jgi:hypothetical protein